MKKFLKWVGYAFGGLVIFAFAYGLYFQSTPEYKALATEEAAYTATPTLTPRPSRTPRPTRTPTATPVGDKVERPYQAGPVQLEDAIIEVGRPIRPANQIVADANMFNPSPDAGKEFILVPVTITSTKESDASLYISPADFEIVGDLRQVHSYIINASGLENELGRSELLSGGSISGRILFSIDQDDTNLILRYDPGWFEDEVFLTVPESQ